MPQFKVRFTVIDYGEKPPPTAFRSSSPRFAAFFPAIWSQMFPGENRPRMYYGKTEQEALDRAVAAFSEVLVYEGIHEITEHERIIDT